MLALMGDAWMGLAEARARWRLGLLSPGHLRWVAWAAQAEGHDGPAIRTLAAEEWHTWSELGDLPERLFAEALG